MLKEGDAAPELGVKDHTGKLHSLKDYQGKKIVLWFYPKADTPGCTAEGCSFQQHRAAYEKKNAVILGVSFDTESENAAFAKKFHFDFPLLCDTERKLGLAYGAADDAKATNARRIGVVIGPEGKVERYFPKVSAQTFPEEALGYV